MRNLRFTVTFRNFFSKVKHGIVTFFKICFNFIKNGSDYAKVLSPIKIRNITLPLIYSAVGWIINILADNKFPNFYAMWGLLFIIILLTRSTTSRIAKLNANLDREMAGDITLVTLKIKYQKKSKRQFLGFSIEPEKDVVLIVADNKIKNDIMNAIVKETGLKTKGGGIIFSLPISEAIGLYE